MQSKKEPRRTQTSPSRGRGRGRRSSKITPPSATNLIEQQPITELIPEFEDLNINENNNPRSFPYNVKQQCWDKADKIKGRDPDRWRRDPLGNTIFRKLVVVLVVYAMIMITFFLTLRAERVLWTIVKFCRLP